MKIRTKNPGPKSRYIMRVDTPPISSGYNGAYMQPLLSITYEGFDHKQYEILLSKEDLKMFYKMLDQYREHFK